MSADIITQGFSRDDYRGPRTLKIETDGGTVTITVGLTDVHGRQVTAVHINPDDESRGGDGQDRVWHLVDGCRLVRQEPDPGPHG